VNWLKNYLTAPWRVLGRVLVWLMNTFNANRSWLAGRMARPWARAVYQWAVFATFIAWIVIWTFGDDEYRNRLTETVKTLWSDIDSGN